MYKMQTYITDEERKNCQKVADAFAELFDNEDLIVLNAERYGFVKLQYFKFPFGFDTIGSFYDSKSLFDELWEEWLHTQLIILAKEMGISNIVYDDVFQRLTEEKQRELMGWKQHFAEIAGIEMP